MTTTHSVSGRVVPLSKCPTKKGNTMNTSVPYWDVHDAAVALATIEGFTMAMVVRVLETGNASQVLAESIGSVASLRSELKASFPDLDEEMARNDAELEQRKGDAAK